MTTTHQENGETLRTLLAPPATPSNLTERVLRAIRERREADVVPIAFDIAASSSGIIRLHPGQGEIDAPSARARAFAERAREELVEYLEGSRTYFTMPIDLSATAPFQRSVLEAARAIPFGEVRSYRWIAEQVGSARAVRAVGTALGRNPVPLVVPCHRVLRSDGGLGGYIFGLDLKNRLLMLERETPALIGSATTRILCRRGCPNEQRITERHQVVFASVTEARVVGYRSCLVCRPSDTQSDNR